MKRQISTLVVAATAVAAFSAPALARDVIQIAGSSTVLPFTAIVAEEFGKTFRQFKPPVVGSGGTGGGLRMFCQGVGPQTMDIVNASRPIRPAEIEACRANGVAKILEVKIGFDGIVFASRLGGGRFALDPVHIFLAQAKEIPVGGRMVPNPHTRWSQIDRTLPNQEITLVIPGGNHGTREVYDERAVIPGCNTLPEVRTMRAANAAQADAFCRAIRTDGRVIEIAGDYTETLARLDAQHHAVGVFGLSFYETNRDRLQLASISGVSPSIETIESGRYPISRALYFYVKDAHIGVIPGLMEFVQFFLSPQVSGPGSPLDRAGLIPLNAAERARQLANVQARTGVAAPAPR